ncbi:bacterial regulatory helix-turn-helix, lysR family protein [Burkholderia cenocepacia]|uniref:Bacterial regulatory helix-turn-helix, lysR family protein n=1 Tax=Burkholderia cenocepacia TaxID=95486 RepID=A0AAN0VRD3_9BURK|nr:bacterial regulatory helix-turn-helix, lysR family protein [Burkholderia cenocepacia]
MIRYLNTFLIAAETECFSTAGAKLGLTQSAVSTQIRRLEEDFNCRLFDRAGKSVRLSVRGRELLSQARLIVAEYAAMKRGATTVRPEVINLGAISTVQMSLLPRALARLKAERNDAQINVVPGTSIQLMAMLETDELDMIAVVRPGFGTPVGHVWLPLLEDRYVAISVASAAGAVADWADTFPFIRYSRRSYGGHVVDQFLRRQQIAVHQELELDEPAVIVQMVAEGLGWSVIPGTLLPLSSHPGIQICPLPGKSVVREIGLLVRKTVADNVAARSLVDNMSAEAVRWIECAEASQAASANEKRKPKNFHR